jgi:hypothetical protein
MLVKCGRECLGLVSVIGMYFFALIFFATLFATKMVLHVFHIQYNCLVLVHKSLQLF